MQSGTWYSNQGEKDSFVQCKVFPPGTRGTVREAPPQSNTECLDVCVQIVNDLPSVSKLINDLKQNHVFYSFSRAAILVSQIISNFLFTGNYSFFIHLFKSEHKNGSLPISNAFSAEVHMVSQNKQQFLVNFYYIAM